MPQQQQKSRTLTFSAQFFKLCITWPVHDYVRLLTAPVMHGTYRHRWGTASPKSNSAGVWHIFLILACSSAHIASGARVRRLYLPNIARKPMLLPVCLPSQSHILFWKMFAYLQYELAEWLSILTMKQIVNGTL